MKKVLLILLALALLTGSASCGTQKEDAAAQTPSTLPENDLAFPSDPAGPEAEPTPEPEAAPESSAEPENPVLEFEKPAADENFTWTLSEDGCLTISGKGAIPDFKSNHKWDDAIEVTSVVIEPGITGIGDCAFYQCKKLSSLTIPEGVTYIGKRAFDGCYELKTVALPESVCIIDQFAFSRCTALTRIELREGVLSVGDGAFEHCAALEEVTLPDSLVQLGNSTFFDCSQLRQVRFPEQLKTIPTFCFSDCVSLTEIRFPSGVKTLERLAFSNCEGLSRVEIPASVTEITGNPFNHCVNMQEITVEEGNTRFISVDGVLFSMDGKTLIACPGARSGSFSIPDTVTTVGKDAFGGCVSLTELVIPESVTTLEFCALNNCHGLRSIRIPKSVTEIGKSNFTCQYLETIEVDPENPAYKVEDGFLLSKDGKTLIACPPVVSGEVTIPDGVELVRSEVFLGFKLLTAIHFPSSLRIIERHAILSCPCLTSLVLPEGVEELEWEFISSCDNLESLTIPASVTHVPDQNLVQNCRSLKDVYFTGSRAQWERLNVQWEHAFPEPTVHCADDGE